MVHFGWFTGRNHTCCGRLFVSLKALNVLSSLIERRRERSQEDLEGGALCSWVGAGLYLRRHNGRHNGQEVESSLALGHFKLESLIRDLRGELKSAVSFKVRSGDESSGLISHGVPAPWRGRKALGMILESCRCQREIVLSLFVILVPLSSFVKLEQCTDDLCFSNTFPREEIQPLPWHPCAVRILSVLETELSIC